MVSVFTGFVVGFIHVISGPDHLAAVAPLAADADQKAWASGLRWGLGHSAGVGVIGLLALELREIVPVDLISGWSERLIGVLLLCIGFWAIRKAMQVHTHTHVHNGKAHEHIHMHDPRQKHEHASAHVHTHAAFGIGALHGLAGSAHFVGVLPALAFSTAYEAAGYLIGYGAGTICAMMAFAHLIGMIALHFSFGRGRVYQTLMFACAVAALAIGSVWLAT